PGYVFHLDPIRVPQKYPGKRAWKGARAGEYTGHPLGKNPGDVWTFPNVKANHIEKTSHPCQFPIELVERFVPRPPTPATWCSTPTWESEPRRAPRSCTGGAPLVRRTCPNTWRSRASASRV